MNQQLKRPLQYKAKDDDLINKSISKLELEYFRKLVMADDSVSPITKKDMLNKLSCLIDQIPDGDKSIHYLEDNYRCNTKDFSFWYNDCESKIEVYDLEGVEDCADYACYYDSLGDFVHMCMDEDGQAIKTFEEKVRFCSLCGKPMDRGYTDEDQYICSDTEFSLYMDDLYGADKWRPATKEECDNLDTCYMYKDDDGNWKPSPWYFTEW